MSPLWVVAEIGFYAKDEAEADRMVEDMASIACRGEIGMGLHVCQAAFAAGWKQEEVSDEDWRKAWERR